MTTLFFVAAAMLAWTWLGYPLAVALLAWARPRPIRRGVPPARTAVTIVIAARDEERWLAEKLQSLSSGGLSADRLEVLVVDDGSRDGTAQVARAHGARVISLATPRGKAVALDVGRRAATHEILVLTDARQLVAPGALAELIAPFSDPRVGAVSGEIVGAALGAGAIYRRLDDTLRRWEARSGSAVGATGALWAVRRSLFPALPPGLVLDDVYAPMRLLRDSGRRVVVAPDARVLERPEAADPAAEWRRRVRTLAGNLQLVALAPWLLVPFANPLWWRFVSHKLLRLFGPFALAGMAVALAALAPTGPGWTAIAVLAAVGLALAAFGERAGTAGALARAFLGAQLACTLAWAYAATGRVGRLWRDDDRIAIPDASAPASVSTPAVPGSSFSGAAGISHGAA